MNLASRLVVPVRCSFLCGPSVMLFDTCGLIYSSTNACWYGIAVNGIIVSVYFGVEGGATEWSPVEVCFSALAGLGCVHVAAIG